MSYGMQGNKVPSGYKAGRLQQFTPEQMNLFSQLFSNVMPGSYLSRLAGGDQSMFEEMEAPAMRQFQELQGGLASRFSGGGGGPGAMGARRGSGFQNAANQQTADFAQNLQSQRQQLQRQAIMDLMGLSESLLGQRPYENFLVEKPQSGWQQFANIFGGAAGRGVGRGMEKFIGGLF